MFRVVALIVCLSVGIVEKCWCNHSTCHLDWSQCRNRFNHKRGLCAVHHFKFILANKPTRWGFDPHHAAVLSWDSRAGYGSTFTQRNDPADALMQSWTFMVLRRVSVSRPITALVAASPRRKVKSFRRSSQALAVDAWRVHKSLTLRERRTIVSPLHARPGVEVPRWLEPMASHVMTSCPALVTKQYIHWYLI